LCALGAARTLATAGFIRRSTALSKAATECGEAFLTSWRPLTSDQVVRGSHALNVTKGVGNMYRMARLVLIGVGAMLMVVLGSAAAAPPPAASTVYVDCVAAPGGDGRKQSPFATITAALPSAKALSAQARVTISVATGVCDDELFPIQLDFPVEVRGSRTPDRDSEGFPLNGQDRDTLVTWTPPSPVPPSVATLSFFRITGVDVRLTKLSLDAKILPGTPGTVAPPRPAPFGVIVQNAKDFVIDQLRIVRIGTSVRTQGDSSGRIRDTYFGEVNAGIVLTGGDPADPPTVIAENNRIVDYWTGAFALAGAGPAGRAIQAVVRGNDTFNSWSDTGPSNPFAVRIGPVLQGSAFAQPTVDALFQGNRFRGTPRYAFILNSGQTVRRTDGQHYSGALNVTFSANAVDEATVTRAVSLITFTNSRATELPCELDPANTPAECPTLMGNPPQYWEYLENSTFDLHHGGELDDPLIDHPEIDPGDGRVLNNVLRINDEVIPHQTFVVVP
jgi:hypothetical protein